MSKPTAPVLNRPSRPHPPQVSSQTLPSTKVVFDERHLFDRIEYITVRLFLYCLALLGMYSVIKDHMK